MDRSLIIYGPSSSVKVGELPEGCKRCIAGEKIVLYTTGSCSVNCTYCPIPEDKQKIDDVFVNERAVTLDDEGFSTIVDESKVCVATGMGLTGGDPMEVPDRTIKYIRDIRKKFGEDYHLHLYTSGKFFVNNMNLIDELFAAGLDELRFHPRNLKVKHIWEIAKSTKEKYPEKSIGFEVPAISGREEDLISLINFADKSGLDFVNLNEYEFTESNFNKLSQRGFVSVLDNAAIKGSYDTAMYVLNAVRNHTTISLHFCSSGSKDSIQLQQRFKKRANQIKREFDSVSEEGLLEYAVITGEDMDHIYEIIEILKEIFDVEDDFMEVFEETCTIETADYVAASIVDELREIFPNLQVDLVSRHPIEKGPIIRVDPL